MSYALIMSSKDRSPFTTWLVGWRLKHGLSQRDLARKLGLSPGRISHVETDFGAFNPTTFAKTLRKHLTRAEWQEAKAALLEQISDSLDGDE